LLWKRQSIRYKSDNQREDRIISHGVCCTPIKQADQRDMTDTNSIIQTCTHSQHPIYYLTFAMYPESYKAFALSHKSRMETCGRERQKDQNPPPLCSSSRGTYWSHIAYT